jgi:RNA polymerase sigma-70 factor (ECF subfamily)
MGSSAQPSLADCVQAFADEHTYVRRTLRRLGVAVADVDDLAQEVFIVMWRRWGEFDQHRPLRPWLAGIAFNVVGTHLRRPRREVPGAELEATDPQPHGEDRLAAARARRAIIQALERLPERLRTVLVLHDLDGVPMRQIAARVGVPLSTAYSRLRKARRDLGAAVRHQRAAVPRRSWLSLPSPAALLRYLLPLGVVASAALSLWLLAAPAAPPSDATGPRSARQVPGLVAYWRFDEASGRTVRDLSGARRDCTVREADPAQVWTEGRLGSAVALDANGWVECPSSALDGGDPRELTVSAWVKVRSLPQAYRGVITRQAGRGMHDQFFLGFSNGRLVFSSDVWGLAIRHDAPLAEGWHQVAFTRSDDLITLYLDGVPVGRRSIRPVRREATDAPILIGGGSNQRDVVTELLDGSVDEVLLYARALDAREIAALAAGAQPTPSG